MPAKKQPGTSQKLPASVPPSDAHARNNDTIRGGNSHSTDTIAPFRHLTFLLSRRSIKLLVAVLLLFVLLFVTLSSPSSSATVVVPMPMPVPAANGLKVGRAGSKGEGADDRRAASSSSSSLAKRNVTTTGTSRDDTPVGAERVVTDQSSPPSPPPPKKASESDTDQKDKKEEEDGKEDNRGTDDASAASSNKAEIEVVANEPDAKSAMTTNQKREGSDGSGRETEKVAALRQGHHQTAHEPKSPSARSFPPSLSSHTWPTSSTFTRFVHEMVLEELGVELAAALYDPLFFDNAVKFIDLSSAKKTRSTQHDEEKDDSGGNKNSKEKSSPNQHQQQKGVGVAPPEVEGPHIDPDSLFLIETNLEWAFRTVLLHPSVPAPLTTVASKLVMLKQTVSLGLARLARDGRLAQEWEQQRGATVKEMEREDNRKPRDNGADEGLNARKDTARASRPFSPFSPTPSDNGRDYLVVRRPIRSTILGFVSYAISFLQVIIDGESRMVELSDWARLHNNAYSKMLWEKASAAAANHHRHHGREKAEIPPHVDAKDPIIHRHLDPLINLLQVITVGPTTTLPSPVADIIMRSNHSDIDWAVVSIMSQSERMRSLANNALEKTMSSSSSSPHEMGKGDVTSDSLKAALSASASRAADEQKVQEVFVDLLRSSSASTPKVFLGILRAYEREREAEKQSLSSASSSSSPITKHTLDTTPSTAAVLLVNILGYATAVWSNRIAILDEIALASKSEEEVMGRTDEKGNDHHHHHPKQPNTNNNNKNNNKKKTTRTHITDGRGSQSKSAALTNRAQYALQYFSNSAYNKWNKHLVNGRFWNSIRSVVGCSSLMKLCEEPDGCRYLCNLNYLMLATPVLDAGLVDMRDGQHQAKGNEEEKQKGDDAQLEKEKEASSTTAILQYAHQAVGFGSNNEYDWELGLVDAFKRASPAGVAEVLLNAHAKQGEERLNQSRATTTAVAFSFPNTIGRITVFDCTLKKWTPPTFLTEGAVGFAHASYCLGLKDVSPLPSVREANGDNKDGVAVVGFPSLRKFINSDGTYPNNYLQEEEGASERSASAAAGTERKPNPFLTRYSTRGLIARNPNAKVIRHSSSSSSLLGSKNAVGDRDGGSSSSSQNNNADDDVIVPSPLYVDYTTFDEISILKLDVEGFEHVAFPSFLRAELSDLHEHYYMQRTRSRQQLPSQEESNGAVDATTKRGFSSSVARELTYTLPLITFDLDAPDSPTISQLGMEFHRQGHKGPAGASYWGAMRAHYSLMQLVSKGFLMFAQEKNPVDYCCYEIALAHYRHFVRSEVWSSRR